MPNEQTTVQIDNVPFPDDSNETERSLEKTTDEEDTTEESLRYEMTSYGADFDVDGLVRRLESTDIVIPHFQRGFVWSLKQASRFIESLLLGLPVPGIFLSRQPTTQQLLVIDGQQRLSTLRQFKRGIWTNQRKEFLLADVEARFEGKSYATLEDRDRRALDNSIIHATVVKQDSPEGDSSVYKIFERLNTGGLTLSQQEIRTAIYFGPFTDLLATLNKNTDWRAVYGPPSNRMRDQELILRFLALAHNWNNYKRPMKTFLNDFMSKNRTLNPQKSAEFTKEFSETISLMYRALGQEAFRPKSSLNAAVFDASMFGLLTRIRQQQEMPSSEQVNSSYKTLIALPGWDDATSKSTADDDTLRVRLLLATSAFMGSTS